MRAIDSLRKEFFSLIKDTGLVDGNTATWNSGGNDENLTRAVICYGLYPGICSVVVCTSPEYLSFSTQQFALFSIYMMTHAA